jgi:hypothetical protein
MLPQRKDRHAPGAAPAGAVHQQREVKGWRRERYWPETLMVTGILVLVVSFWLAGERTLVAYGILLRWFAAFAFAGNLVPYAVLAARLGMERLEWFLFNLLAVGPLLLSAGLWINLLCHGPETLRLVPVGEVRHTVKRHWTEHGTLPRGIEPDSAQQVELRASGLAKARGPFNLMGSARGCLGYTVITRWEPLYEAP